MSASLSGGQGNAEVQSVVEAKGGEGEGQGQRRESSGIGTRMSSDWTLLNALGTRKRVREDEEPVNRSGVSVDGKEVPKLSVGVSPVEVKVVPELDKVRISRSDVNIARQATGVVGAKWSKENDAKSIGLPEELRESARETARKTEQLCDWVNGMVEENKRNSERLAQALRDYETEKTARAGAESRLSEEVKKRAAAEAKFVKLREETVAYKHDVRMKESAAERAFALVHSRLNEEVVKGAAAEDRAKVALNRCAVLEEKIAVESQAAKADAIDALMPPKN